MDKVLLIERKTTFSKWGIAACVLLLVLISILPIQRYYNSTVMVPDVSTMTIEEAKIQLENEQLKIDQVVYVGSDSISKNHVVEIESQEKRVKKGAALDLYISNGRETIIENYNGLKAAEIEKTISERGVLVELHEIYSEDIEKGLIMNQDKEEGSKLFEGEILNLTVSKGREPFKVGSYENKSLSSVEKKLEEFGIKVTVKKEYSFSVKKDSVIKQSVASGKKLYKGDSITLTVSKGVEQVKVPNLIGLSETSARSKLSSADLSLGNITKAYDSKASGTIINQSVSANTVVNKKSSINVTISLGPKPVQVYKPSSGSGSSSSSRGSSSSSSSRGSSSSSSSKGSSSSSSSGSSNADGGFTIDIGSAEVVN